MPRKSVKERNIRKLVKSGKKSFSLTIPIELIKELAWRLRQKVIVKKYRRGILIKDWKKRKTK
jgi:hypothetical protein